MEKKENQPKISGYTHLWSMPSIIWFDQTQKKNHKSDIFDCLEHAIVLREETILQHFL